MNVVEHYITQNYTQGRPGLDMLLFYVIHTYNGAGTYLGKQGDYGWFQTNLWGTSSNNAVLKDGTIERIVRREDTAHHAGNWWANVRSISYEMQDDANPSDSARTDAQYEAICQDIAHDAFAEGHKALNASNIKPHWEFTSTGCPGGVDLDRIRNRANEILQSLLNPVSPVIDSYYRVLDSSGNQLNAYSIKDIAFNFWLEDKSRKVTYQKNDITLEFKNMANTLEEKIQIFEAAIKDLNIKLESMNAISNHNENLIKEITALKKTMDAKDITIKEQAQSISDLKLLLESKKEPDGFNLAKAILNFISNLFKR